MGSGGSTQSPRSRRISMEIETDHAISADKVTSTAPLPFPSEDQSHVSRRVSQINFNPQKQLEGYGGVLTSKTALVGGYSGHDFENEFKLHCIKIEDDGNGPVPLPLPPNLNPSSPTASLSSSSQDLTFSVRKKKKYLSSSRHFLTYHEVPILEKRNLCQAPEKFTTYHLEIDISLVGIQYDVADTILIIPENPPEEVKAVANFFHYNLDDTYDFQSDYDDALLPFPSPFTVRQALTSYLDLMGKPKKDVLESVHRFVTDEKERGWLEKLLTGPPAVLNELLGSGTRYSKIFLEHLPSLQLSLEQLISLFPMIKPRTYTAASSPLLHPNTIHLCAACHHHPLPSGEMWYGLCSAYLERLQIGSTMKILHRKNGFELPSLTTPVILIGIGSGIAALRSIIQHRSALAEQNKILNHYVKTILLYECNDPEEDFLYYDEICEANRNRSVTTCHVAFSQRAGTYRTITDLLTNPKIRSLIGDSMDIGGGRIYCSGNKETVRTVEQSIVQLVMEKDGVTEQQAIQLLQGADQVYSSQLYAPTV